MKRDKDEAWLGGVCAGIAKHLEVDAGIVRLLFLGSFLFFGIGPIIYLLLWLIMPSE